MIDIDEIEREIKRLESKTETTYWLCERLSWLYTVRDHLRQSKPLETESYGFSGSEFLDLVNNVDYNDLVRIFNDHMTALQAVQPKVYNSLIRKLKGVSK